MTRPRNLWHRPERNDVSWSLGPIRSIDLTTSNPFRVGVSVERRFEVIRGEAPWRTVTVRLGRLRLFVSFQW